MHRIVTRSAGLALGLAFAPVLALPALAATTAAPTSVSLKAAHSSVAPKHKDTLTGTLKSGGRALAGQTVVLEQRAAGSKGFAVVAQKATDAQGHVSLSVVPGTRKGQKEQYELVFRGTQAYKASHSSVITLTVS